MRRVIVLVLDGVGCGELPDAGLFGDTGSNTLVNLAKAIGGLRLPNLGRLGLGNIVPINGVTAQSDPQACYGSMAEQSHGKDSTIGHWEIAGLVTNEPFPLFPNGFPFELTLALEQAFSRKVIGNKPASGTMIIEELGREHLETGCPIVYTSADSVLQIACHEDVIPLAELYRMCEKARALCTGDYCVARVIARPFVGEPGRFRRTSGRRDFSCPPPALTLLDRVKDAGLPVIGIGKVDDLFAHRGFTTTYHSVVNDECFDLTVEALAKTRAGLVFANFIQFDTDWGHRNDPAGFAHGLEEFDARLPELVGRLRAEDILFITADHGNDPTTPSTDHTREYVPLLVTGPKLQLGMNLGRRASFADLGQTVAEFLSVQSVPDGKSFLEEIVP